jgi:hypothetical protein
VDSTIVYNYGFNLHNNRGNIIAPDFLLTYSDIWTKDKNIPAKCIEVGFRFSPSKMIVTGSNKNIVVISSNVQEKELEEIVIVLATAYKSLTFYYKLHPAQFAYFEKHTELFKNVPNVVVVGVEKNIKDLLDISNEFLAIYSTAMYEALQAGKIIHIYKRLNYKSFKSYFDLPQVFLFDDVYEFTNNRRIAMQARNNNEPPQFYKPFNEKVFRESIERRTQ